MPKPSLEELSQFASQIGLPEAEAERAYFYWEAQGWKVGKNPMKCWKAALQYWFRTWRARVGQKPAGFSKPLSVWEIDKKLEAMRAEQNKLVNHPARQPRMENYTWNDGQVSKVQNGWIYPAEVQKKIDQLRIDINKLKEMKAQVPA